MGISNGKWVWLQIFAHADVPSQLSTTLQYSGKFSYISYECSVCENKNWKFECSEIMHEPWPHNTWIASLVFCQITEQPTQRSVGISPSITVEAKRLISLELCHHAVLQAIFTVVEMDGCVLAALAYEIKTSENLFCGLVGQIYENLHQQKFPAMRYLKLYGTVHSWLK